MLRTVLNEPLSRKGYVLALATVTLSVAGLYAPFLEGPFLFDDRHSLVLNPAVRSLAGVWRAFVDPQTFSVVPGFHDFRPLLLVTYAINFAAAGMSAFGFRVGNLVVFCLNLWIVAALLRRTTGERTVAVLAGTTLFALHPTHSQVVLYAASRSESLAATFVLTAVLAWWRAQEEASSQRRATLMAASALAVAAAMTTKESGLVFVPAVACLAVVHPAFVLPKDWRRVLLSLLPLLIVIAAVSGWRRWLLVTAPRAGVTPAAVDHGPGELLARLQAFGAYPRLAALPYPLSVLHELPTGGAPQALGIAAGLGAVGVSLGCAWLALRKRNVAAAGLAWFGATLAPYLFVNLNLKVNEHRLHLALVGPALAAAILLGKITRQQRLAAALVVAVAVAFAALTAARARDWTDEERFWRHEIEVAPGLAWGYQSLAVVLDERGRHQEAAIQMDLAKHKRWPDADVIHGFDGMRAFRRGDLELARREFLAALTKGPPTPDLLNNLGSVLDDLGDREAAERHLRRAVAMSPGYARAHFNLALVRYKRGDPQDAARCLRAAIEADPDYGAALATLGSLELELGETTSALPHLQRAVAHPDAGAETWLDLARALARLGREAEAVQSLATSVARDPSLGAAARDHPDFSSLQARAEFRDLMRRVPPAPAAP